MKVLLLTHLYPSAAEPTLGPFNFQTFEALDRHCELRLIAPLPWWSRIRTPSALLRRPTGNAGGIPAEFPTYWSIPKFQSVHAKFMVASLRKRVAKLRREFPFDIIFTTWGYPDAVAGASLARKFGVPFVVKVHGSDINEIAKNPSIRKQIQEAFARAQKIIAVSAALKDRLVEMGIPADKVIVLRNAVDGERFRIRSTAELRAKLGLPLDRKLLCYVGRLSPEKGVDLLIGAIGKLAQSGLENLDLAIVGGGGELERLRSQAQSLGITDRVRFAGFRLHDEVPDWIAACDIFCLPSRREGCPNVVLEALASGKPVVAANVGGVPELLNQKNGVIVQPESADAFAQGIKQALAREWDPEAQRQSVEFLSWNEVGEAVYETLKGALSTQMTDD